MTADTSSSASSNGAGWESRIGDLLTDLSAVQSDLLKLLSEKHDRVAARDSEALTALQPEEARLTERLMDCHRRRQQLLDAAAGEGLPAGSLEDLTAALPQAERATLAPEIDEARRRARLLQHKSLTNWVLVQRTLLHLSQMIEIIATGGRMQPTYGESAQQSTGGAIVDQAV